VRGRDLIAVREGREGDNGREWDGEWGVDIVKGKVLRYAVERRKKVSGGKGERARMRRYWVREKGGGGGRGGKGRLQKVGGGGGGKDMEETAEGGQ